MIPAVIQAVLGGKAKGCEYTEDYRQTGPPPLFLYSFLFLQIEGFSKK